MASNANASSAWRKVWTRRGPMACLLLPLAVLHRALVAVRRALYRNGRLKSTRVPVPVITVGNVIAGGAGKTPVTIAMARQLQAEGWRPGIVSRGYGRDSSDCRAVTAHSTAGEVGDEPLLIARTLALPVFVAPQRAQAAQALLAAHPGVNVVICDDGLQHLALARDIEVCVFNSDGIGNGWLLPAGPLREPWPRKVDLVLYAGNPPGGQAPQFSLQRRLAEYAVDAAGRKISLASLRDQPVHAVAAIARPEDFFAMLRERGLTLAQTHALPDHDDFREWAAQAPGDGAVILCTEKDATKLWPRAPNVLAVPLETELPSAFFHALNALLKRYDQRHGFQIA